MKQAASDFGRVDLIDKLAALLRRLRLGHIEDAGLNFFATESDGDRFTLLR